MEDGPFAVVAALIVLAYSRQYVEQALRSIRERALTASVSPADAQAAEALRNKVRAARERQQREAERAQAEVCFTRPTTPTGVA
jgi:hypothetical protein